MNVRYVRVFPVVMAIVMMRHDAVAGTIRVPADQPTVQQAIDVAIDGDTVLVAAGTYLEAIDFKGKAIVVTSEAGADVTILDAKEAGSVVTFANGEGPSSVLAGFTIQGGSGTWHDDPWGDPELVGGGVFCLGASPVIRDNVLPRNRASMGGGIYCGGGGSPRIVGNRITGQLYVVDAGGGIGVVSASPTIEDNDFSQNHANGAGGGIYAYRSTLAVIGNTLTGNGASKGGALSAWESSVIVRGNLFEANWTDEDEGGAISLRASASVVERNRFVRNSARISPSAIAAFNDPTSVRITRNVFLENDTYGVILAVGDVLIDENLFTANRGWDASAPTIDGRGVCTITRNVIQDGWTGISASGVITENVITGVQTGIQLEQTTDETMVSGNRITRATDSGISMVGYGAPALGILENNVILDCFHGIGLGNASPHVRGNLIARCSEHGIGIDGGAPAITRNTIAKNAAGSAGAGILVRNASVTITSNIVWDNMAPSDAQIFVESGSALVSYCDVEGGWPGTGNLDADPQFVDAPEGDWRLRSTSPCIDAGDPADRTGGKDLFGGPRFLDGNLDRTRVADMGAQEYGNVHLEIWRSGRRTVRPGGAAAMDSVMRDASLVIDTSGQASLSVFLLAGLVPAETEIWPFGPIFLDLAKGWIVLPWGTIPSRVELVAPSVPGPVTVVLQELALDPATGGAGNTSNPVTLSLQ